MPVEAGSDGGFVGAMHPMEIFSLLQYNIGHLQSTK